MSRTTHKNRRLDWYEKSPLPEHVDSCTCSEHCEESDRRGRCRDCSNHVTIGNLEYGHEKDCEHRPSAGVDAKGPGGSPDGFK